MRFFAVLLISTVALSTSLWLGRDLLFEGESMAFQDIVNVSYFIADALEYDEPVLTENATFTLFHFNERAILEIGGKMALGNGTPSVEKVNVRNFLSFFDIPYTENGSSTIIPECIIKGVKFRGGNLFVEYYGNPAFDYSTGSGFLDVESLGYVLYAGKIYKPGERIMRLEVGNVRAFLGGEAKGRDIVILEKPGEERKILVVAAGSGMMKPLPSSSFGLILARGNGIVIVRPVSPDLEGLDKKAFNIASDMATVISRDLGYRIEYFPMVDIPPGTPAVVVLLRSREDLMRVLDIVRRMTGIEKIVNSAPDFSELPDLGS